jgi:hypothetical protein
MDDFSKNLPPVSQDLTAFEAAEGKSTDRVQIETVPASIPVEFPNIAETTLSIGKPTQSSVNGLVNGFSKLLPFNGTGERTTAGELEGEKRIMTDGNNNFSPVQQGSDVIGNSSAENLKNAQESSSWSLPANDKPPVCPIAAASNGSSLEKSEAVSHNAAIGMPAERKFNGLMDAFINFSSFTRIGERTTATELEGENISTACLERITTDGNDNVSQVQQGSDTTGTSSLENSEKTQESSSGNGNSTNWLFEKSSALVKGWGAAAAPAMVIVAAFWNQMKNGSDVSGTDVEQPNSSDTTGSADLRSRDAEETVAAFSRKRKYGNSEQDTLFSPKRQRAAAWHHGTEGSSSLLLSEGSGAAVVWQDPVRRDLANPFESPTKNRSAPNPALRSMGRDPYLINDLEDIDLEDSDPIIVHLEESSSCTDSLEYSDPSESKEEDNSSTEESWPTSESDESSTSDEKISWNEEFSLPPSNST